MTTQAYSRRYLPLLVAGVAVVLFSTAGLARIAGWLSATKIDSSDSHAFISFPTASANVMESSAPTVPQLSIGAKSKVRGKGKCANCGLIMALVETESDDSDVSRIDAAGVATGSGIDKTLKLTKRFKMIVRMADGSIRAIDEPTLANWRIGEQVILIAGTNPSN